MSPIEQITPQQAENMDDALLIDVREQDEWDTGHIEGARHIPLSTIMHKGAPDLPKDKNIILYCAKGMRSQHAADILSAQGYSNLKNMMGGYDMWLRSHA